mmetsp:Transcript_6172/g.8897  ORF Transcript_6172/g.8897 Transcript_6172/m.8897 type:complete len:148 (+) Transcript_6172:158-601(+)|eukprot:CAMPEP_0202445804 /NCGR_PEP_ID=MMETSP1360-20130828/4546_1 /ASSEMBLY_ACC=CAM_ASM_000848 /TAXON_ID=515479 /ORGANISM="Licmophora paradoxa, Strain CCMP2313" /LENGTH=147 /DNA_ID=CAMNT_0049062193 /DNA_START=158 /DNA_END=601 /DNA_ORIENTATION=+
MKTIAALICCSLPLTITGFAFVPQSSSQTNSLPVKRSDTSLKMVDQNVIMGAGIAIAGLGAGIGLVAFTEIQGERAKERGSGLSDGMSTRITGMLMEDVEVSSISDLGSLTSQLEAALKETGGADEDEFKMSEEDKKRIAEEVDDGW